MKRIIALRKDAGLSQAELADIVKVHQTAVSQWETGKTYPDMLTVQMLADYFCVSVDYLLDRTSFPYSDNLTREQFDKLDIFGRSNELLFRALAEAGLEKNIVAIENDGAVKYHFAYLNSDETEIAKKIIKEFGEREGKLVLNNLALKLMQVPENVLLSDVFITNPGSSAPGIAIRTNSPHNSSEANTPLHLAPQGENKTATREEWPEISDEELLLLRRLRKLPPDKLARQLGYLDSLEDQENP